MRLLRRDGYYIAEASFYLQNTDHMPYKYDLVNHSELMDNKGHMVPYVKDMCRLRKQSV